MNWKDVKKIIKDEGYSDEEIQKVKSEIKSQFGDYLDDKNLLWRKIALELDVRIADDQLSSSRDTKRMTVEEFRDMDEPEEDDVSYELEGFFFDIQRGQRTSTGKPKTSFKFCDETGIIPGAVYGDQSVAQMLEPCKWFRVENAGRYVPRNTAIMTIGKYSKVNELDSVDINEKVERSVIGEFKGVEEFPFDSDDREDKIKWVRGLVTDEDTFEYSGCEKCNYKFDEDSGKCNNPECDGTIEENQTTLYFHTMMIQVPKVGGYEFSISPTHATGNENYRKDFIEAIVRGYDGGGENGPTLNVLGVNVLSSDKEKEIKREKQRQEMEKKKAEADEDEWSDAMKAVYEELGDGKVMTTKALTDATGFDRGAVVTAAARLEEELGVISYPKAGMITRKDVEAPDTPEEESDDEEMETDVFDKDELNEVYGLMSDGRIWTSEAVASRLDVDASEVGGLLSEMQSEVDTIEFEGFDKFQRVDVSQTDEVAQPVEHEGEEDEEEGEEDEEDEEEGEEDEEDEEEGEEDEEDEEDEEEEFVCDECGKTYQTQAWLTRHKNQEHADDTDDSEDDEGGSEETKKEDTSDKDKGQASLTDIDEDNESVDEDEEESDTDEDSETDEDVSILEAEEVREAVKDGVDEEIADAIVEGYTWIKQFEQAPIAGIKKKLKNEFSGLSDEDLDVVEHNIGSIPCVTIDDYLFKIVGEE